MTFKNLRTKLLKQRRFRQLLISSSLLAILIGFLIVPIEKSAPGSTIKNTSDGLWWATQTLTTVGYGDVTPVTGLGRIVGVVLQIMGTLMFGSLLAIISTSMSRAQEEFYWTRLFERLGHLENDIASLKKETRYLVNTDEKLKTEIEHKE